MRLLVLFLLGLVFTGLAARLFAAPPAPGEYVLSGQVVDEDDAPIAAAVVTLRAAPATQPLFQGVTDPAGRFSARLPAGSYLLGVQRAGFYEVKDRSLDLGQSLSLTIILTPVREVFQSVDVNATPSPVDLDESQNQERLTGTQINDVPFRSSNSLRNAMQLMPRVLEDQTGALHFAGGAENQTLYTLNGFDIGDPVTGRLSTQLGLDGVRSAEFHTGRFSPEFGKGSTGVLALQTDSGTDQFHLDATNFIPGIDTHNGVHLGGFTPRVVFSGPLKKGRAWFNDDFDAEYSKHWINGLPPGGNSTTGWMLGNVLHTQLNLTPAHILYGDFLVNEYRQDNHGLGVLDPVPTTTDDRERQYFWSLRDQLFFGGGSMLEFGFAQNFFTVHQAPQGNSLYLISPQGREGNHYVNSNTRSRRDQFLAGAYLPHFRAAGQHQLKAGAGLDRLHYDADFQRTGYQLIGLSGAPLSETIFQGNGRFNRPNLELYSYLLDDWRPRDNVQVELGLRLDWDELVRSAALGPRLSVSWAPFHSGSTKLSAGYALTYDSSPLALFGQPLDQYSLTTFFNPDGTPAGPAAQVRYAIPYGRLSVPRGSNWNVSLDQRLPHRLLLSADYLHRDGTRGFAYLNSGPANPPMVTPTPLPLNGDELFLLANQRRDRYQSFHVGLHQSLGAQFEWSASYIRSATKSDAVLDVTIDQVTQVLGYFAPVPWDAPNRFLGWTYLPLPLKNWFVSLLCDTRSGFPYSVVDQHGLVVGSVNSHRYPYNFDLNLYLERRFTFRGRRFAVRGGFNNITDSRNPTAVYNTVGAPNFGQFLGWEGRHFQARIRFFGRP